MSSALNRRAALGILSMGSVAFLAACGSDKKEESNSSASASASQTKSSSASSSASATPSASESPTPTPTPTELVNDGKDYSGVANLDQYETPGEYQPATAQTPAQNVPTPVIPEAMHQNTVAGFASALAYFGAAVDYLLQTGDMKYVREVSTDADTLNALQKYADRTMKGIEEKTWYEKPSATMIISSKQPTIAQGAYNWTVDFTIDLGEKLFNKGKEQDTPSDKRYVRMQGEAVGRYINNVWDLHMDID